MSTFHSQSPLSTSSPPSFSSHTTSPSILTFHSLFINFLQFLHLSFSTSSLYFTSFSLSTHSLVLLSHAPLPPLCSIYSYTSFTFFISVGHTFLTSVHLTPSASTLPLSLPSLLSIRHVNFSPLASPATTSHLQPHNLHSSSAPPPERRLRERWHMSVLIAFRFCLGGDVRSAWTIGQKGKTALQGP